MRDYWITCPYCFEEFHHTDVHFRSEIVNKGEFNGFPDDGKDYDDIDDFKRRSDAPFTVKETIAAEYEAWEFFKEADDEKYNAFWKEFGSTTEDDPTDKEWGIISYRRRVLDPADPRHQAYLEVHDGSMDGKYRYLVFDSDGFAMSVKQTGSTKRCDRRVCPHCHNPLPQGYGKFPVKSITVIGITGAGKTVYLSKLIKDIQKYVSKVGLSAFVGSKSTRIFLSSNRVKAGEPLPGSTPSDRFLQPLFYDLTQTQGNGQVRTDTFVLYDVAGENCVDSEKISRFGRFIDHADGIFLLIDPIQFEIIQGFVGSNEDQDTPTAVLEAIHRHVKHGQAAEKVDIPMAVCISKSDMEEVQDALGEELSDALMEEVRSIKDEKGRALPVFDAASFNVIAEQLQRFISSQEQPLEQMLYNNYSCYTYFAFSSLGCAVEDNVPKGPILARRIEEPLFWLFNRFGYIGENEPIIGMPVPCPRCGSLDTYKLPENERERSEGRLFNRKIFFDTHKCNACGHRWDENQLRDAYGRRLI